MNPVLLVIAAQRRRQDDHRPHVALMMVDGREALLCVRTQDGQLRKIYAPLPQWVTDVVEGLELHAQLVDLRDG